MQPVALPVQRLPRPVRVAGYALAAAAAFAALWLTSTYSYLFFHSIAEIFIVAVAAAVFMVSWSARGYPESQPFVLLGIGYLFVAILEILHTLSYEGMNILPVGQDHATKLWIAARGLQAVVTLAFAVLVRLRRTAPSLVAFLAIGALAAIAILSIFVWDVFPLCFVEGSGVTPFKKASEYAISVLLLAAALIVIRSRESLSLQERVLLSAAFVLNAAGEIEFTLYVSAFGTQNLIGHLLMFGSFGLAYQALFATKIRARMALIHELQRSTARLERSEEELRAANLSKDRFLSIIAHDLRNPISGFLSLTDVLAGKFHVLDEEADPRDVRAPERRGPPDIHAARVDPAVGERADRQARGPPVAAPARGACARASSGSSRALPGARRSNWRAGSRRRRPPGRMRT